MSADCGFQSAAPTQYVDKHVATNSRTGTSFRR
jgi:hypothetical protein